jgi:CO/xanthine dehydrogenase Mo-binding subunit
MQVHEGGVARAELRGSTYGAPERFNGTNICYYLTFGRENVEKGFAQAEHVFEDTFRFQKVQHYSLEAHNNISYYDGEKLTVWSSCQDPFTLRDHLSGIFSLPLSRIRVIVPYVGGGYGGKLYVKAEPISAALSWMTRRPVKLTLSVNESFQDGDTPCRAGKSENRRSQKRQAGRPRLPGLYGHRRLRRCRAAGHPKGSLSITGPV